mmetsp:Transcript_27523/g.53895  ORF Transcript_27523/g.53895 Transcript_27523/m.53895 type:complete len:532 (+) Transcript_27523:97-1692(+)
MKGDPTLLKFLCGGLVWPFTVLTILVAGIAALWLEELACFRDNKPGAQWVNWVGEFSCGPNVTIVRPKTLIELQDTVGKHASVRAAATGHSFNPFACPDNLLGAVVDMRAFKKIEVTLGGNGSAQVKAESGITMGQLQNEILARGLTLRVPPGNSAYTVGGCIATGCHNLGQSHAQDLLAVTFVLHNGTVQEVKRGDLDFSAAAVSIGRLGIILSATLEVLPYRTLQWSTEQLPMPETPEVIKLLEQMTERQKSRESVGNKLVFYLATRVMMMEYWVPTGRAAKPEETNSGSPLGPYHNPQGFRLGQGRFSNILDRMRHIAFGLAPHWWLSLLQVPAEVGFRGLHASPLLSGVRQALGWQHSPEARGEASARPVGNRYTWAGWIDEVTNLIMGLRHVEVIFPLHPPQKAAKCLDAVFAHKHLAWWRLNVRTQKSESFLLSSTHSPAGSEPVTFLRVDFVAPGALLDMSSGEASLTAQLHSQCPGWRKHWGKGLFATSAEEQWGEPQVFLDTVGRWDPAGKFRSRASPSWLP